MSQGVYREGGAVGGLPLPRARLTLATTALLVCAIAAVFAPLELALRLIVAVEAHFAKRESESLERIVVLGAPPRPDP